MHWGYCDKARWNRWLINKIYSPQFRMFGKPRGQVSPMVVGPGQLSGMVFKRVLTPVLRAPPQRPDHLVRSPTPDTITLENRTQRFAFGEGMNTHIARDSFLSVAAIKKKKTLIGNIVGENRVYQAQSSRLQCKVERKPQQWKLETAGHTTSTAESREK